MDRLDVYKFKGHVFESNFFLSLYVRTMCKERYVKEKIHLLSQNGPSPKDLLLLMQCPKLWAFINLALILSYFPVLTLLIWDGEQPI